MNIRDLRYLVALAELKNFGRASERCFVSQPTLSMQIKKLEQELEIKLFERDKKFVRITSQGEIILQYAIQILQLVDDMKQVSQAMTDPCVGTLKLGIFPTLGPYLLPQIIRKLNKQLPDLSIKLYEQITELCVESLLKGSLDAIIIATDLVNPKLNHLDLFIEDFYLAFPANHNLSKIKTLAANSLPENELLLLEEGHCLREQGLEYCQRIGKEHNTDFAATSLSTIMAMVGLGKGITLIPALSVSDLKHPLIKIKPFNTKTPKRKVRLYWRKSLDRTVLFNKLAKLIKESIRTIAGIHID